MPMVPVDVVRSLTAAGTPEQCLLQVAAYSIRPNIYPALLPVTENYEEIIEVFAPRRDHGLPSRGAGPYIPAVLSLPWTRCDASGGAAVCILAACTFFACAGGGEDPSGNE